MPRARQSAARRWVPGPQPGIRPAAAMPVPYDYGVRFELDGQPGNLHEQVLVTAPDGVFVAVAVGYGFAEERHRELSLQRDKSLEPTKVTMAQIPIEALLEGFRLTPRLGEATFTLGVPVAGVQLDQMLRRVKPAAQPDFLFSIVDTATGRELQDEPTHSLASLGIATGERPFRRLAYPISFIPRSSLRLQVVEQSAGTRGTLFIVFYGYRVPLGANCPEPLARLVARPAAGGRQPQALPPARVVPFDYVASIELTGTPSARQDAEITISVDNEFVATAIGYGLATGDSDVALAVARALVDAKGRVNLAEVPLGAFPLDALRDGIRIRPELHRIAFRDNGNLADKLLVGTLDLLFERINRPEDVSFTYSIFDSGTGHDLQNIELHNIAGLGTASGERPFKQLAVPLRLQPRSTVRISIEELFGRGRLFMVLQGYKRLGSPAGGRRS
jgi:hypothetical protein